MKSYLDLCRNVLINGEPRSDRTGTGTLSIFGECNFVHELDEGFPLLTTKKIFWKGVVHELLWMLKGDTNIKYLNDNDVHIWDAWADEKGDLGPVYGIQWRHWNYNNWDDSYAYIDQIKNVIDSIKSNPYSRRHIVSAWNVADIEHTALPPCHVLYQFYVSTDGFLSLKLYQRSADLFLGVPFNIASYALLTHMVAHVTGLKPGTLYITYGDLHIYTNHIQQIQTQLGREPLKLPEIVLNSNIKDIDDFTIDKIKLVGYNSALPLKGEVSI